MLVEPAPSPFDLRWRMFGIGVRVHPTFWLFSILFGWRLMERDPWLVVVWVACMFVSILFHELGHVITGRIFGSPGNIVLYSFGGLAIGSYQYARPWQRIIIALAGPAAGFALFGIVHGLDHFVFKEVFDVARFDERFHEAIVFLLFMNFYWSILNLIPIFPLDGGQVLREVCSMVSPRRGTQTALGLSFVIGGLVALYGGLAFMRNRPEVPLDQHLYFPPLQPLFVAILFGLLALQNLQMYRQMGYERGRWDDE